MTIEAEFSRLIHLTDITPSGVEMNIEASPQECAALTQRFNILGIASLKAHVLLVPQGDLYRLEASLKADVTQACVVTLDPVPSHIEVEFSRIYGEGEALEAARQALEQDIDVDAEAEDEPDPIENGAIDVGEAVAEELALSLDPFPRKPGASLEGSPWDASADGEGKPHPFAALAKLRDKMDKKE